MESAAAVKTLHLNLMKKWFDMTLARVKKEEYREITPYWINRLTNGLSMYTSVHCLGGIGYQVDFKEFETITFSNGYAKDRPQFEIELIDITIGQGKEEWGAEPGKDYFILKHGEIIPR